MSPFDKWTFAVLTLFCITFTVTYFVMRLTAWIDAKRGQKKYMSYSDYMDKYYYREWGDEALHALDSRHDDSVDAR